MNLKTGIPVLLFLFSLEASPNEGTTDLADMALTGLRDVRYRHFLEAHRPITYSGSRTKRSAIFSTGVKVCPQETAKAIITSHRAYYKLRVCQEAIWEAFRIFFDRVPNTEEYMAWVLACQHENLCMDDLARNFSSSQEHLDMVATRVAELGESEGVATPEPGKDCPFTHLYEEMLTETHEVTDEPNVIPEKLQQYIVEFSVTVVDPIYSELLKDPLAPQYEDVIRELRDKMYHVFENIPGFKEIRVLGFRAEDVSVRYAVLFNGDTELSDQPEGYHTTNVETQGERTAPKLKSIIVQALKHELSLPLDLNTLSFNDVYEVDEYKNKIEYTATPPIEERSAATVAAVDYKAETQTVRAFTPEGKPDLIWIESVQAPAQPAEEAVTQVEHALFTEEENNDLPAEFETTEPEAVVPVFTADTPTQATLFPAQEVTIQQPLDTTVETLAPADEDQGPDQSNEQSVSPTEEGSLTGTVPESSRTEEDSEVSSEIGLTEEDSGVSPEIGLTDGDSGVSSEIGLTEGDSRVSSEIGLTEGDSGVSSEIGLTDGDSGVSSEIGLTEGDSAVSSEIGLTDGDSGVSSEIGLTEGDSAVSSEIGLTDGDSGVSSEIGLTEGNSAVSSEIGLTEGDGGVPSDIGLTEEDGRVSSDSSPTKEDSGLSTESSRTEGDSGVSSESSLTEGGSVVSSETGLTEGDGRVSSEIGLTEGDGRVSSESSLTEKDSGLSSESSLTEGDSGSGLSFDRRMMDGGSGSGLSPEADRGTYEVTPAPAMRQASTPVMAAVDKSRDLVVLFSLRVTNMMFTDSLINKDSPEYKSLENTFLELTQHRRPRKPLNPGASSKSVPQSLRTLASIPLLPYLETNLTGFKALEILNFQNGSVIVNSRMKLNKAVPYNVTEAVHCVLEEFCNSAANQLEIQVDSRSLEVEQADEPDPCKSMTCSEFSRCVVNGWTGEPECMCDPGYSAVDGHPCQSLCILEPDFCLNGGLCQNIPGHGATCRCPVGKYWHYHGERCDELVTLPMDTSFILTGLVGSVCLVAAVIGILIFINKKCIQPHKAVTVVSPDSSTLPDQKS